jgi:glycine cleavage system H protein
MDAAMRPIPHERMYSPDHIWIEMDDDFVGRCGITEIVLKNLDYIEFIEFPDVDILVRMGVKVGMVESHKEFFDITTPVSGLIIEINSSLEFSPDTVNSDPYGKGWIYKIDVKEPNEFDELMVFEEYMAYAEML